MVVDGSEHDHHQEGQEDRQGLHEVLQFVLREHSDDRDDDTAEYEYLDAEVFHLLQHEVQEGRLHQVYGVGAVAGHSLEEVLFVLGV